MSVFGRITLWAGATCVGFYLLAMLFGVGSFSSFQTQSPFTTDGHLTPPDISGFAVAGTFSVIGNVAFFVAIVAGIAWAIQYLGGGKGPLINTGNISYGRAGGDLNQAAGGARQKISKTTKARNITEGSNSPVRDRSVEASISSSLQTLHEAFAAVDLTPEQRERGSQLLQEISDGAAQGASKKTMASRLKEFAELLTSAGAVGTAVLGAISVIKSFIG